MTLVARSSRPESPEPLQVERGAGAFRAGFGSVDITPPPGLGLSGNGPEGQQARGWRHRLSARAMLLEDSDGERIDSWPKALARTLELLDADWFLETAWEDAVRRFYDIPFE